MTLITRSVHNPRSIPCPLRIPGYDATLPLLTIAPSATLDLLTVITEDQLVGAQETLAILVAGGALTVTDTIDLSNFTFDGVLSVHADANPHLTSDVQLVSGSHITLSQVGQTITVNATGELSQSLTNSHIFVGNVGNIATDVAMSGDVSISNTGVTTVAGLTTKLSLSGGSMTGNINMQQHQLVNAVIQTGTSEPGSPIEGQIFYNTTSHQAELWNGSSWVILG